MSADDLPYVRSTLPIPGSNFTH